MRTLRLMHDLAAMRRFVLMGAPSAVLFLPTFHGSKGPPVADSEVHRSKVKSAEARW
jgi:hypothetical protein